MKFIMAAIIFVMCPGVVMALPPDTERLNARCLENGESTKPATPTCTILKTAEENAVDEIPKEALKAVKADRALRPLVSQRARLYTNADGRRTVLSTITRESVLDHWQQTYTTPDGFVVQGPEQLRFAEGVYGNVIGNTSVTVLAITRRALHRKAPDRCQAFLNNSQSETNTYQILMPATGKYGFGGDKAIVSTGVAQGDEFQSVLGISNDFRAVALSFIKNDDSLDPHCAPISLSDVFETMYEQDLQFHNFAIEHDVTRATDSADEIRYQLN